MNAFLSGERDDELAAATTFAALTGATSYGRKITTSGLDGAAGPTGGPDHRLALLLFDHEVEGVAELVAYVT
jgi:hypothetical protein